MRRPGGFFQTAEAVVATTLAANDRGQVVVIPVAQQSSPFLVLRHTPEPLLMAILSRASAKYHLQE